MSRGGWRELAGPTMSRLAQAIGAGRFVLTTGLGTLRGVTREELQRRLRVAKEGFAFVWLTRLRQAGIDAPLLVDISVRELPGVAGCHISSIRGDPEAALAVVERI